MHNNVGNAEADFTCFDKVEKQTLKEKGSFGLKYSLRCIGFINYCCCFCSYSLLYFTKYFMHLHDSLVFPVLAIYVCMYIGFVFTFVVMSV